MTETETTQPCPEPTCGGIIADGLRCRECGALADAPLAVSVVDGGDAFDLEHRELCVDGACIGVVGADGVCKVCGTPGRGAALDPRQRGLLTPQERPALAEVPAGERIELDDDFDDDRELCIDGACIGVIGADGRCKECGLAA